MIDINKYYTTLVNYLNKYKTKKLGFECGVACGYVTRIELNKKDKELILYGLAGWESEERILMIIIENMTKGKEFKYWKQYHIFERFE